MSEEDKQDDVDDTLEGNEADEGNKKQKPASGPDNESKKGYVSEEAYKGLQRTAQKQKEKMDKELLDMKTKLEEQEEALENAKLAALDKAKLESEKQELSNNMQKMQAEKDKLARQLNQQSIVLAKFPDLAPLAAYIPPGETDEQFETNATNFRTALKTFVTMTVKGELSGSSPAIEGGNGSEASAAEDALWDEVYKYAGIPGKEKEYEEANAKLQKALKKS